MTSLASKPIRRKVQINGLPYGIKPHLIISLYPGGILAAGTLYARLVASEAKRR